MRIDLHSHSAVSDGTQPPADVVRRAHEAGVDVLALTDHDTIAGWDEAVGALPPGLTLIPGIELSCHREGAGVHLLGYLFDPGEPELAAERTLIRDDRIGRAQGMVERLRELGVPITWEQVARLAQGDSVGRPHVARAMVETGVIGSFEEAFTPDWIGVGGRAEVHRYALDPVRAVRLVAGAGGVSVVAHPRSRSYLLADELIEELAAAGLTGLEVDHPGHEPAERARLRDLATGLGLVATGSSDDHGELTGHRLGCETTVPAAFEALVAGARGRPVGPDHVG